jgi:hypothetical protein
MLPFSLSPLTALMPEPDFKVAQGISSEILTVLNRIEIS